MQTQTNDLFNANNAAVAPDDAPRVILNPVTHQYFHTETGEAYASVSSLLNMVKTKFDKVGKAKIVAARDGRPVEEVVKEWDAKADESRRKGTELHARIETILVGKTAETDEKLSALVFDALQAALTAAGVDFGFVSDFASELILWNDEFKVAGTADGVYIDDEKVIIVDWKTNEYIDHTSKYGQKLLSPLDDIDDCNYNHYALQLSFYAFFIEENTGRKPDGLYLLHVRENWPNEGKFTIERIEVPYMRNEVLQILNLYGAPQEAKDETPTPAAESRELELLQPTVFSTTMYTSYQSMKRDAETVVRNVKDGRFSVASVFTQAKKIIKATEIITEGLKDDFEKEAYKYAKTKAFNDCIITEENRANIQFAENEEYARLEREMKIVKDLIKEATESGKPVPHPHTGELIAPVGTKPSTVVKVTIK